MRDAPYLVRGHARVQVRDAQQRRRQARVGGRLGGGGVEQRGGGVHAIEARRKRVFAVGAPLAVGKTSKM